MSTLPSLYLVTNIFIIAWIAVNSQTLYDTDCNQCNIFNQDRKITALRSALEETENRLRETTTRLEGAVQRSEDAYNDLLRIYGSQISPNGKVYLN
jgi:hypothetical protein